MAQAAGPCLVVGSSRGLGAALVEALLSAGAARVLGVARTPLSAMTHHAWAAGQRYQHIELDVTADAAPGRLEAAVTALPPGPLLVIHNAAAVKSDLPPGGGIDWAVLEEVNRVGVTGFANTLRANRAASAQPGAASSRGSPRTRPSRPVRDPRLAYPVQGLPRPWRSGLRQRWRGRVRVVTVHLGNMGPSGRTAGAALIEALLCDGRRTDRERARRRAGPDVIGYPWPVRAPVRGLLPLVPDRLTSRFSAGCWG